MTTDTVQITSESKTATEPKTFETKMEDATRTESKTECDTTKMTGETKSCCEGGKKKSEECTDSKTKTCARSKSWCARMAKCCDSRTPMEKLYCDFKDLSRADHYMDVVRWLAPMRLSQLDDIHDTLKDEAWILEMADWMFSSQEGLYSGKFIFNAVLSCWLKSLKDEGKISEETMAELEREASEQQNFGLALVSAGRTSFHENVTTHLQKFKDAGRRARTIAYCRPVAPTRPMNTMGSGCRGESPRCVCVCVCHVRCEDNNCCDGYKSFGPTMYEGGFNHPTGGKPYYPTCSTYPSTHSMMYHPTSSTYPSTHSMMYHPTCSTYPPTHPMYNHPTGSTYPPTHSMMSTCSTYPPTHPMYNHPTGSTYPQTHSMYNSTYPTYPTHPMASAMYQQTYPNNTPSFSQMMHGQSMTHGPSGFGGGSYPRFGTTGNDGCMGMGGWYRKGAEQAYHTGVMHGRMQRDSSTRPGY